MTIQSENRLKPQRIVPVMDSALRAGLLDSLKYLGITTAGGWERVSGGPDRVVLGNATTILRLSTGLAAHRSVHQVRVLAVPSDILKPSIICHGTLIPDQLGANNTGPYWDWLAHELPIGALAGPFVPGEHSTTVPLYWSLETRLRGHELASVWPRASGTERSAIVDRIAEMTHRLHFSSAHFPIPPYFAPTAGNGDDFPAKLTSALEELALMGIERTVLAQLAQRIDESNMAAPFTKLVPAHVDIHPDNILIADSGECALIDFEWARMAPADIEWDNLLRWVFVKQIGPVEQFAELVFSLASVGFGLGAVSPERLWFHELCHHIRWALHHFQLVPEPHSDIELIRHIAYIADLATGWGMRERIVEHFGPRADLFYQKQLVS